MIQTSDIQSRLMRRAKTLTTSQLCNDWWTAIRWSWLDQDVVVLNDVLAATDVCFRIPRVVFMTIACPFDQETLVGNVSSCRVQWGCRGGLDRGVPLATRGGIFLIAGDSKCNCPEQGTSPRNANSLFFAIVPCVDKAMSTAELAYF